MRSDHYSRVGSPPAAKSGGSFSGEKKNPDGSIRRGCAVWCADVNGERRSSENANDANRHSPEVQRRRVGVAFRGILEKVAAES
jgi:hypothetical protein